MPRKSTHGLKFRKIQDAAGNWHRVPVGIDRADYFASLAPGRVPFTLEIADQIVSLYTECKSLEAVAKEVGVTRAVIYFWMARHADFKLRVKAAREIRGFVAEDKAIQAAEEADEDNVQAQRLKAETYRWAAAVNNPEVHGTKTKIVGDPNQPVSFIIDTGIRREEAIDTKELEDKK